MNSRFFKLILTFNLILSVQLCKPQLNCIEYKQVKELIKTKFKTDKKNGILLDTIMGLNLGKFNIIQINNALDSTFLKEKDLEYLSCQLNEKLMYQYWHEILGDKKKIKPYDLIENYIISEGWESFRQIYGRGFYMYTFPFIDKTGKKAILIEDYYCGPLCGGRSIVLFVKRKNKWICVKKIIIALR